MYKAILYKEWLKIRWAVLGYIIVLLGFLTYIGLEVRYWFGMNDPISIWLMVIQKKILYYSAIKFLPVFAGIVLAVVQFVPEVVKKRYRLTFHLPISETRSLLFMTGICTGILLLFSVIYILGLTIIGGSFFPREITSSSLLTVAPWLLAGLVGYLGTAAIVIESSWIYRLAYALMFTPFIMKLFAESGYNEFQFSFGSYLLVSLFYTIIVLFPGYRLRKGSK
ncbi:hypothetical protein KJ762_00835 [bacterium]|nr:hypothetical protein [bacterium]MBU1063474.1 hypothetical protein [bacterium]MBU1633034.1 hypothetical protein [bacterium]MBU1873088.1 hypothetical protein [bacterium]